MNPITKKHLHRRTLLKGIGASFALPMLDAMTPAFASTGASAKAVRLSFNYVPNGVVMADWTPKATGRAFELTRILKPMAPFRDDLMVLERQREASAAEIDASTGSAAGREELAPRRSLDHRGGPEGAAGRAATGPAFQGVRGLPHLPVLYYRGPRLSLRLDA
jgi:hypothetical protein